MGDRRARAKVDKDTWLEFKSESLCGLCGNTGMLVTSGVRSPRGFPIPPVANHCICPNGRVIKAAVERERRKAQARKEELDAARKG